MSRSKAREQAPQTGAGGMAEARQERAERKRGEGRLPGPDEALRAREEALSQILQGTAIPVFVINNQHEVTHWNQACQNLTGVLAEDMIGTRNVWMAFYQEERPVMADLIVDRQATEYMAASYSGRCHESAALGGAFELEAFFQHFGEGGKWLLCTAAPLRDPAGNMVGAIETFQDVTERKRAEMELQRRIDELSEAKRRMEVVVANTTDREKRMVDLKREVNELLHALGRESRYRVPDRVTEFGGLALTSLAE